MLRCGTCISQSYLRFIIDVEAENRILGAADRVVIQFPVYWYSFLALLKQWEDDIMHIGQWSGKEMLVAASFGANNYGRGQSVKYTANELLSPFQATGRLTGMKYLKPFTVTGLRALPMTTLMARLGNIAGTS